MEVNNSRFYKLKWFWNILSNGLFLFGVRNRLARMGLDFDPYYWVLEGNMDYEAPKIKGDDKDYEVIELSLEEITEIKKKIVEININSGVPIFNDQQKGIGIINKGQIAAFMLIELNDLYWHKRKISLNANEAYLFHMYTFEEHRGKNLAPFLRYHSYIMLKEIGKDKIYSITQYFNKSSKNFKKKLKAKNILLYINISLFGKYQTFKLLKKY
ncbi:hypothetical protein [Eudoraea sp.]|uniref:hypothetical protein n=2 Tax=Eudoraea sp. TaxID=1979955 RepID=UPI003C78CEE9